MQRLRLFWAINLPSQVKKDLYHQIKTPLSALPVNLKWVADQNIHLTLQFLGDVEAARVRDIYHAVQKNLAGFGSLTLGITALGVFPGRKSPRVFWAGLSGQVKELGVLHSRVQGAHIPLGFKPDKRRFAPHITLARFRSPQNCKEFLQRVEGLSFENNKLGAFVVEQVDLMQSTLTRGGPIYKVLETVILGS